MIKIRMLDTNQEVVVSRGEAHALIEAGRAELPNLEKPKRKKRTYSHRMMRAKK